MADYKPPAPKLQEQDLKGKVALVTGAAKGIGRAIALDLATRGCSVLGTYSSPQSAHLFDTLSHTVSDLYRTTEDTKPSETAKAAHHAGSNAPILKGIAANIKDLTSIEEVIKTLESSFPSPNLDILILSAAHNVRPKLGHATAEEITSSLTANIHWPIAIVESLVQNTLFNSSSRVVVISSDRVRDPVPGTSIFNASKTALESLARSWAVELPLTFPGTTVNAVSVGLTDTPGVRSFPAPMVEAMKAQRLPKVKVVPGGRLGFAEDVADVVGWLVSEKARWITGSVVAANGGAEWVGGSS